MTYGLNPRTIVAIMGGDVTSRDSCNVPGPGHSKHDRSLSIKIVSNAPGGFVVFSHVRDDWKECRDYICSKLGIGDDWRRESRRPVIATSDDHQRKKKIALKIWSERAIRAGLLLSIICANIAG